MVDIIVDSREKFKEYFVSALIRGGYKCKVEALPVGDFLIFNETPESSYLIERKEANDFLGSLEGSKNEDGSYQSGRLWDQIKRMKESNIGNLRIVVEGDPLKAFGQKFRRKKMSGSRIYGAYEGIYKWGIPIVFVESRYQTTQYLKTIINRMSKKKKEFPLRTSAPHNMSLKEKKLYILQGFPNIGPKASKELLKRYKTLWNLFQNIDNIDDIPGIGEKTKEEIIKILKT